MRRVTAAAAGAVSSVVLLIGAVLVYQDYRGDHGPLTLGESTDNVSQSVAVGSTATYGLQVLRNTGGDEAVLDSAQLLGGDGGARVVDVKTASEAEVKQMWGSNSRYPPPGVPLKHLRPVAGTRVPATGIHGPGVYLIFGVQVDRPGRFSWEAVQVDYRVGSQRHRLTHQDAFTLCAPKTLPCSPE